MNHPSNDRPTTSPDDKAQREARAKRLEELQKRQAEREKKRELEADEKELERAELVDKFETELGPIGREFQIVDATALGEGFIVVKLGTEVGWKKFQNSKVTEVDVRNFVLPCVAHPEKEKYDEIVTRRPALANRCANALATLHGAKLNDEAGKF